MSEKLHAAKERAVARASSQVYGPAGSGLPGPYLQLHHDISFIVTN
jgi:hypothetical protein